MRSGGQATRWGAARLRRLQMPWRRGWEARLPALEKTTPEERREASWKARLDKPADGAKLAPGLNVVGGWAIHEWRRLQGVLVTVDRRPHAFITEFHERHDVARKWAGFPTADRAGWTAMVDLGDAPSPEVVISAYAFLEPRRRQADGEWPRMGPVRRIGTVRCEVRGAPALGLPTGEFYHDTPLVAGFARIMGQTLSTEDVATVELLLDGHSAGLARTSPGEPFEAPGGGTVDATGPEMITATQFEGVVELPSHVGSVSLSAQVRLLSGRTFRLDPWPVEVSKPVTRDQPDATRLALVRGRSAARLDALARGTLPQEPRVLVATHDLGLGGGQLYLHELMRRLVRQGVRFAVSSPRPGVLVEELEAMGVPVLITGPTPAGDPEAYEAQISEIAELAVQFGCRSVLANTVTAFTGADAGLRLGLPLTWAIHESFPFGQFWMEAYGPGAAHEYVVDRARRSLGAASRVVFEAAATQRLYEPLLAPGAGVVVPYGVDLAAIERFRVGVDRAALRAELGIAPDSLALLCMGTIEPRKSQLNLARAFGESPALRGSNVELIFVGALEGSPYSEQLIRFVDRLGDARIRVEPVQPDIYRWYHAADVLVCASDVESLPRSMLEAMAFGRPVASTAVFGIPELVEDGQSGFLCPDRDLRALRGMLERVAGTSRERLTAMGAHGRDVVTERHDPEVYEHYYLRELSDLDEARRVKGATG